MNDNDNDYNRNDENNTNGELKGFDSVNGKDTSSSDQGYTITPDGGYYTKQKSDIIQDNANSKYNNADYNDNENEKNANQQSSSTNYCSSNNGYSQTSQSANSNNKFNNVYYTKKPKQKKSHHYNAAVIITSCILAALIGAASGIAAIKFTDKSNKNTVSLSSEAQGSNVNINVDKTSESVVEAVAEKVTPSVVGIRTTTSVMSFFGGSSQSTGEGSGVIYKSDGYIITNYHVIQDALSSNNSKIEVFVGNANSDSYQATVVGYNISSDLAVLKIDVTGLTTVEIGTSDGLKVGQYVITVGNPGGLEFMDSVTYGVISGLNRVVSTNSDVELIQTDAAINPGNSGGALVNTNGQLIGVNSSKIVSEEYEGMGFAIPVDTVVKVCDNIISKQNSPEPYIGITVSEKYTADVLKLYGYPTGAVVLSVADNSPAQSAGIQKGDIITEFNGKEISDYTMLNDYLQNCTPKSSVSVKIYRNGRYYTTNITIGSNNAQ